MIFVEDSIQILDALCIAALMSAVEYIAIIHLLSTYAAKLANFCKIRIPGTTSQSNA